jgi:hypothetical protein
MAHEIGHVALHGEKVPTDAEETASLFATELLAPVKALRHELPVHVTLVSLAEIKRRWGVSIGALIPHLHHNGLIDSERLDTLRKQLYTRTNSATGRTWGKDEPGWDLREIERPKMLGTWIERCIGTLVPAHIASVSGLWPADLIAELLCGQEERAPAPRTATAAGGSVVSMDAWRAREA